MDDFITFQKEIYREVEEETQIEAHKDLGMFVLVIMSHGQRGDIILDVDKNPVDLVKVYNLLSPAKFPAMAGKPKMVIIQACSGGKKLVGYHIYAFNNL